MNRSLSFAGTVEKKKVKGKIMVLAELSFLYVTLIVGGIMLINVIAVMRCYKNAKPGYVLVRTGLGGAKVSIEKGIVVIPVIHSYEVIDISAKQFQLDVPVEFSDGVKDVVSFSFILRIAPHPDNILEVMRFAGKERLENPRQFQKLFEPTFSHAIIVTAQKFTKEDFMNKSLHFQEYVLDMIGADLNGFCLEAASPVFISPKTS